MAQNPSSTPGKQVRLADRAAVEKRSFQHTLPAANIQNIDANRDVRRCHVVNRTIISAAENRRSNSTSHEEASFCLIVINNTVNRNVKRRFVMNRPDVPIGNNSGNHENINAGLPEFSSAKNQGEASFEQWKIFSVIRPKLRQQVCCSSDGKDGLASTLCIRRATPARPHMSYEISGPESLHTKLSEANSKNDFYSCARHPTTRCYKGNSKDHCDNHGWAQH
ncbi:hypothetical protein Tco_1170755 [Tanacetum coccineum]